MQQPANPQPPQLTPQHVEQLDEYVKKALQFVDSQLYNELREFYKPIRKMMMQVALPTPQIQYREKIVEVESITQKKEIERLRRRIAQLEGRSPDPFAVKTNPEAIRAQSVLNAIQAQPHLF